MPDVAAATLDISTWEQLVFALQQIDAGTVRNAFGQQTNVVTINLLGSIAWNGFTFTPGSTPLPFISNSNANLTINGNGFKIDGNNRTHGLIVRAGTVSVENLEMAHLVAQGGEGGTGLAGGGGGAGLGGALYVGAGANVTVSNVVFAADVAVGGAGGHADKDHTGGGGGGGMGPGGGSHSGEFYSLNGVTRHTGTGGGGGGGTGYYGEGDAYGNAGAGSGGGQTQDYVKQFSLIGIPIQTDSGSRVWGALSGFADGGNAGNGGSALSGGGGGGIGGASSAPYYNPETLVLESFPGANLLSGAVVGALSILFPPFGFVAASTQLSVDLATAIDSGTWSPLEIAGLAFDVLSVGSSAKAQYSIFKESVATSLAAALRASRADFAKQMFEMFQDTGKQYAALTAVDALFHQEKYDTTLETAFNAIKHGLGSEMLPQIFDDSSFILTGKDVGYLKGDPTPGASGGWGGGGGGGGAGGGDGGWAGGGGGGGAPIHWYLSDGRVGTMTFVGGNGGFGGGGGGGGVDARGGLGGFGAGNGTDGVFVNPDTGVVEPWLGSGGGGLGAGGAIFVEQGGGLAFAGNVSFNNDYAQGGTALNPGMGLGNDIFLQGSQTLVFNPSGDVQVLGGIADEAGADSNYANRRGSVLVVGTGDVLFGGQNSFAGNLMIGSPSLDFANQQALATDNLAGTYSGQTNGHVIFGASATWNPAMTVYAEAGARLEIQQGAHFVGAPGGNPNALKIDMSGVGAGGYFDLQFDAQDGWLHPTVGLVNWSGSYDDWALAYAGDHLGLMYVNSVERVVELTSDGKLDYIDAQGAQPTATGTMVSLVTVTNPVYQIRSAADLTLIDSYIAQLDVTGKYTVDIIGTGVTGDIHLVTTPFIPAALDIDGSGYSGNIYLSADPYGTAVLTLHSSALTNASGNNYFFGGTIHDMGGQGLEYIDLADLTWSSSDSISRSGNVFTISDGASNYSLTLGDNVPDMLWGASDGHGGTLLFKSELQMLQVTNSQAIIDSYNSALTGFINGQFSVAGDAHQIRVDVTGSANADVRLAHKADWLIMAIHGQGFSGNFTFTSEGGSTFAADRNAFTVLSDDHYALTGTTLTDFGGTGIAAIGLHDLSFDPHTMHYSITGSALTVDNGIDSYTLTLGGALPTSVVFMSDGTGGTLLLSSLNDAFRYVSDDFNPTVDAHSLAISLPSQTFTEALSAIEIAETASLTIYGNGATIDGGGTRRGIYVSSGTVSIDDLGILNAVAQGGAGGSGQQGGGGGGAGLGGGLFVGSEAHVSLTNVDFSGNSARGGDGGSGAIDFSISPDPSADGGGGGGLGGNAIGSDTGGPRVPGVTLPVGAGGHGAGFHPTGGGGEFGGGGGASYYYGPGGTGGWGGGGGGGSPAGYGAGQSLGFPAGLGGFGAGNGSTGGGGGLGAGGNIFVQAGGTLSIAGTATLADGSVAGGTGGTGTFFHGPANGSDGSAYGSGIFLQGGQVLTLDPGPGNVLTIGGTITDEAGSLLLSGNSAAGATSGSLSIGSGTVLLEGYNNFTGGVQIVGGNLQLDSFTAAGSGAISFADGYPGSVLTLGSGSLTGYDTLFNNVLVNFGAGDAIDLAIPYDPDGVVSLTGSNLSISEWGQTVHFTLQNYASSGVTLMNDGRGGTWITSGDQAPLIHTPWLLIGNANTPIIASAIDGTAIQISDTDAGMTGTVTVTLSAAHGLITVHGFQGVTIDGNGTPDSLVTLHGRPTAISTALEGLIYQPNSGFSGNDELTISVSEDQQDHKTTTKSVPITIDLSHHLSNDFNGDGRSDVLWRQDGGRVTDWLGNANSGLSGNFANADLNAGTDWHIAGTGDFNGDGRSDVLWRNDNGDLTDWLGHPNGNFSSNFEDAYYQIDNSWHVAGTGDFNGDGYDDILWRNDNGRVTDWLGQAGSGGFTSNFASADANAGNDWHIVGTGDFNGDGRSDILWRNDNGDVTDWLGQAGGGFASNFGNAYYQVDNSWHIVGTGDFNGDGITDILWRNDSGRATDWLGQSNTTGGFTSNFANADLNAGTDWHIVSTGDFNGDGIDDVLWRNDYGDVTNWLGQANGNFVSNFGNAFYEVDTSWHVQEPAIRIV